MKPWKKKNRKGSKLKVPEGDDTGRKSSSLMQKFRSPSKPRVVEDSDSEDDGKKRRDDKKRKSTTKGKDDDGKKKKKKQPSAPEDDENHRVSGTFPDQTLTSSY